MALSKQDTLGNHLIKGVQDFMDAESKKIVEKHVKQMEEELEAARGRMITNAIINISQYSEIQYMRDRIVFEVRKVGNETK